MIILSFTKVAKLRKKKKKKEAITKLLHARFVIPSLLNLITLHEEQA